MAEATNDLERQFHQAMLGIYEAARKLKPPYVATRFHKMVLARGGKRAADALLASANPSEGFTELWLHGKRLDLSVEYLVLQNPWQQLFTPDQLAIARQRLQQYKFALPDEASETKP